MWKYLLLSYFFHFWQFQSYSFYMLFGSLWHSYLHSVYPDSLLTLPLSVSGLHDFHGSNPQFLHPLKWAASVAALFSTSLSMTLYNPEIWIIIFFFIPDWVLAAVRIPHISYWTLSEGVLFYQPASDAGLQRRSCCCVFKSVFMSFV